MKITKLDIANFRCIKKAEIYLDGHSVFVGDNNAGKSTVFEAIDLVLGPDRSSRNPVVDEHDFFAGEYLINSSCVQIFIEVIVIDLNEEQQRYFQNHLEFWDQKSKLLISGPPPESTDGENIVPAVRCCFKATYDVEEDDFVGQTFFSSPQKDNGELEPFRTKDKRLCGFLFLRTLRTGTRALSLEHGSLLDIILSLKELRPQMWEKIITQVFLVNVAKESELGVSAVLLSVQKAIHTYLPIDSVDTPEMKVSSLTRESLRKAITVFMDSGSTTHDGQRYLTPYYHQGTGTVNVLVLSLLSIIADLKKNVIFAMEEPEIAIPPYTQKRIVFNIVSKSTQALFSSHSPYVLEEFDPMHVIVFANDNGNLCAKPAGAPPKVKHKEYKEELRKRFCESLLAKRVLIAEGRTEYDVYSAAARKLEVLDEKKYMSFDRMGISLICAETDSQIASLGQYYKGLGKTVYAVFDKQDEESHKKIQESTHYAYEAQEHGIENVILRHSDIAAIRRYALHEAFTDWPQHLNELMPNDQMTDDEIRQSLFRYFTWSKGSGTLADFLVQCSEEEMPEFIRDTILSVQKTIKPIIQITGDFEEKN